MGRLREYEVASDKHTNKGPEVERIYFLILEMSRKLQLFSDSKFEPCISIMEVLNTLYVTQLSHT